MGGASAGALRCPLRLPLPREATEGAAAAATEIRRLRRRRWRRQRQRPGFLLRRGRCPRGNAGGAGPAPGASARPAQQPAPRPEKPGRRASPSSQGCPLGVLGARDPFAEAEALGSNRPPTTDKLVVSPPRGRPSAELGRGGRGSAGVNPLSPVLRPVLGAQWPDPRGPGWASSRRRKAPALALLSRGEARARLRGGARVTGPRVREVSRATEEPRGGIAPQGPAAIRRAIPSKRDPRTRGKKESLSRLKNIRALAKAWAAAREPLAASACLAPLPPSGRGGGAPRLGALGRAGLRRDPSWSSPSPPPPGGLRGRGPRAGGAGPGCRARLQLGFGPRERSARSATWASLCCFFPPPSFSFRAPPPPPPLLPPPLVSSFGLSLSHPLSLALLFDSPPVKKKEPIKGSAARRAQPLSNFLASPRTN